jgi:hypothetical protein
MYLFLYNPSSVLFLTHDHYSPTLFIFMFHYSSFNHAQMVAQSDIEVVPPGDSRSRIQVAGQGRIALHDAKDHRRKMLAD